MRELRYADNSQSVSQQTGSSGWLRRKTGGVCRTRNFAASQSMVLFTNTAMRKSCSMLNLFELNGCSNSANYAASSCGVAFRLALYGSFLRRSLRICPGARRKHKRRLAVGWRLSSITHDRPQISLPLWADDVMIAPWVPSQTHPDLSETT